MTGIQAADIRRSMGLTPKEFAVLCGVNEATVYRWETCLGRPVPPMVESTRRVFLMLQGATRTERLHWASTLREHGWRPAWGQMFHGASRAKTPVKARTIKGGR